MEELSKSTLTSQLAEYSLNTFTAHSLTVCCNKLGLNGLCLGCSFSAAYQ